MRATTCSSWTSTPCASCVTLEGQKYVTGSLVIPMVERIRKGLFEAHERLQVLAAAIGVQILPDGEEFDMESILQAMIEDFESM